MATRALLDYLAQLDAPGPVLVIDRAVEGENYRGFTAAMPAGSTSFYAVKANPHPMILQALADLGSSFDAASVPEIEAVLACTGVGPERISYGNTIKTPDDIDAALRLGVRLFVVDCIPEVEKIAEAAVELGATDVRVFCRIMCAGSGAAVPLDMNFGCTPFMAVEVLTAAHHAGLLPVGVSFHVGSQQLLPTAWDEPLEACAHIMKEMCGLGIDLSLVNLGGGFPTEYSEPVPDIKEYGAAIREALTRHFGDRPPTIMTEPGRRFIADAGDIRSRVVLVSRRDERPGALTWVYLDVGVYSGLVETVSIRYKLEAPSVTGPTMRCVVAGRTCDSLDKFSNGDPYDLPAALRPGDFVRVRAAGAYVTAYETNFNGFAPMTVHVI